MRLKLALFAAVLALAALPQAASAWTPPGFIGISPQSTAEDNTKPRTVFIRAPDSLLFQTQDVTPQIPKVAARSAVGDLGFTRRSSVYGPLASAPDAAMILRSTRSCIHCVLHQSTGDTCSPPTSIVKWR